MGNENVVLVRKLILFNSIDFSSFHILYQLSSHKRGP